MGGGAIKGKRGLKIWRVMSMSFCIQANGDLLNGICSTVMYTGVWEIFMQNISDSKSF